MDSWLTGLVLVWTGPEPVASGVAVGLDWVILQSPPVAKFRLP